MNVLVDTCVWSLILRRSKQVPSPEAEELRRVVDQKRARIIGPIRQELLSGIRHCEQFETVRLRLAPFPDVPITADAYVEAARFCNVCQSRGVQGSDVDFLICAVAAREDLSIYTTDQDFHRYAKCLPITLYSPQGT